MAGLPSRGEYSDVALLPYRPTSATSYRMPPLKSSFHSALLHSDEGLCDCRSVATVAPSSKNSPHSMKRRTTCRTSERAAQVTVWKPTQQELRGAMGQSTTAQTTMENMWTDVLASNTFIRMHAWPTQDRNLALKSALIQKCYIAW